MNDIMLSMEARVEFQTEESVLQNVSDILSGCADQQAIALLDGFKYSAKPDDNKSKIEAVCGYKSD